MSKIQCSKLWNTVIVSPNKGYAACFSFVPFFPPIEMKQFDLLDLQLWKSKTLLNLEDQFGKGVDFVKIMFFHNIFYLSEK